jgi:hypothetical protein
MVYQACSKRRILHAECIFDLPNALMHFTCRFAFCMPNAFKTLDNQPKCLIIHCFECIRRMQNATFRTGLIWIKNI